MRDFKALRAEWKARAKETKKRSPSATEMILTGAHTET